ncbi:toxin-antitoxin system YwqK family antitoxin [Flavobacterium sp. HJ-32-4]|uniref:toxin-antitoxin system YwqK family antitoxin n=1 Tax=Flavobacterium sp. HJ-32-4 TaxID=1160795 RepID=UPI001F149217|nr:hypothetical protein [Flavobacterium sp. HJ-32-4]UMY66249.1 hypothetical protein MKO97_02395 [Flavobacterium sp. HJ-32-4]
MKKAKSLFVAILACLTASSCQRNEDNPKLIKSYPKENKIAEFGYLLKGNDTIIDGEAVYYSLDKKTILGRAFYKNGLLNGIYTGYYGNGKIEQIVNYRNDTIIGDRIHNYTNGSIERYILYDESGRAAFLIKFDSKGNVIDYQGHPIVDVENVGLKKLDSLEIGDSLKYSYYLANIPASKYLFTVRSLRSDKSKNHREISSRKQCRITVKEKILVRGENSIIAKVKFEFSDLNKTTISDSLRFDYYVR